jgi:hypothetical protein
MRRAAVSIPSNIAEGAARQGDITFIFCILPFELDTHRQKVRINYTSRENIEIQINDVKKNTFRI